MRSRCATVARPAALTILAAIAMALLHQHPSWHGSEQRATCGAAVWHNGAVLDDGVQPALTVAWIVAGLPLLPSDTPRPRLGTRAPTTRAPPTSA